MRECEAVVLSCEAQGTGFAVVLDQTVFYPQGGGQAADSGAIDGISVLDVQESGDTVVHLCAQALEVGKTVHCVIDFDKRFDQMQQHTAEHILSGLVHSRWGHQNSGFHMGAASVTVDFDGVVPSQCLQELEDRLNQAIWEDIPLNIWTPSREELPGVFYRTKRALPWPVRIVEVPGYDACACCGLHVARTGQAGPVKLLSVVNFRGGSRIEMLSGRKALAFLNESYRQNRLVSQAFSARLTQTGQAARAMNDQLAQLKGKLGELERREFARLAEQCRDLGDVLVIRPEMDAVSLRQLADQIAGTCGGIAAVFAGGGKHFGYCLVSRTGNLQPMCKTLNFSLNGRGGGKPNCVQGSVCETKESILNYFVDFTTKFDDLRD